MSILTPSVLYARFLAQRGELAKSLFWSKCRDIPILAKAGMSLQILQYAHELSPYRIEALLQLGRHEEVLSLWKRDSNIIKKAHCWGKLAVAMPEEVLQSNNIPADVLAYCLLECGRQDEIEISKLSPFMRWKLALRNKNYNLAIAIIQDIFCAYGLTVPLVQYQGTTFFCQGPTAMQKKTGPLVSVIMTCYNEEKYIQTAINSILAQNYEPIELIIVDDASTDTTPDIIMKFAAMDRRILPLFFKKNKGTWSAKNYALEKASGEYIMMHDADDWSHPDKIPIMLQAFAKQQSIQCVSSRHIKISETSGEPVSCDLSNFIRFNPSSLLFRRTFIKETGGYLNLLGADCEIAARHEVLFGAKAHVRLKFPLSIALSRKYSLSSCFRSVHNAWKRIEDWETWHFKHVAMVRNKI